MTSPTECLFLFFDDEILKLMVNSTNSHITEACNNFSISRDCLNTNIKEIKVFNGLLILAGLLKFNYKSDDLWEKEGLGVEVFWLTMSLRRFKFLLRYLHFTSFNNKKSQTRIGHSVKIGVIGKFISNCERNFE